MMRVKNHQIPPMMRVDRALGTSSDPGRMEKAGGPGHGLGLLSPLCLTDPTNNLLSAPQRFSVTPWTSSGSGNLWEHVSDAHAQAPSLALRRGGPSNLGLGSPPGGSDAASNFRTTALAWARFSGSSAPVVSGLEHLGVETPGLCTDSRSPLCDCARHFPSPDLTKPGDSSFLCPSLPRIP